MRIRYDERLVPDLEAAVGLGQVRLLGQRGATARLDGSLASTQNPPTEDPAVSRSSIVTDPDLDDSTADDSDDL